MVNKVLWGFGDLAPSQRSEKGESLELRHKVLERMRRLMQYLLCRHYRKDVPRDSNTSTAPSCQVLPCAGTRIPSFRSVYQALTDPSRHRKPPGYLVQYQ